MFDHRMTGATPACTVLSVVAAKSSPGYSDSASPAVTLGAGMEISCVSCQGPATYNHMYDMGSISCIIRDLIWRHVYLIRREAKDSLSAADGLT